jgi:hypothetical protein
VSSAVVNLRINSTTSTTLVISWEQPVNYNGDVTSYFISIINLSDGSAERQLNVSNTYFTETNLGKHVWILCSLY